MSKSNSCLGVIWNKVLDRLTKPSPNRFWQLNRTEITLCPVQKILSSFKLNFYSNKFSCTYPLSLAWTSAPCCSNSWTILTLLYPAARWSGVDWRDRRGVKKKKQKKGKRNEKRKDAGEEGDTSGGREKYKTMLVHMFVLQRDSLSSGFHNINPVHTEWNKGRRHSVPTEQQDVWTFLERRLFREKWALPALNQSRVITSDFISSV